jgi:hypothetical protein
VVALDLLLERADGAELGAGLRVASAERSSAARR